LVTAYSPVFATLWNGNGNGWETVHLFAVNDHLVWVSPAFVVVLTTIDIVLFVTVFNAYYVLVAIPVRLVLITVIPSGINVVVTFATVDLVVLVGLEDFISMTGTPDLGGRISRSCE
jgi:hypothetical protein